MHHPVLGSAYAHLTLATGFSPSTAQTIVSETHLVLEELGIPSTMVEAFLATYHAQLLSHKLYSAAATLRQIAYPAFPAVYEQAFQSVETGLLCTHCNNPINNPIDKTVCETCKKPQAPCAVCLLPESPYDLPTSSPSVKPSKRPHKLSQPAASRPTTPSPRTVLHRDTHAAGGIQKTRLFTSCALCNHAQHTACAYTWFTDPVGGGGCPVEACLCDCAPGAFREEKLAAARLQAEVRRGIFAGAKGPGASAAGKASTPPSGIAGRASPSSMLGAAGMAIQRDEWDVGQSRAVKSVRGALREGSSMSDTEVDRQPGGSGEGGRRGVGRGGGVGSGGSSGGWGGRSNSGRGSEAGQAAAEGRRVRVVGPGD